MAATDLVQQAQTVHPVFMSEVIQCLIGKGWMFGSGSMSQSFGDGGMYLVYHIDKCLGFNPTETSCHPDLIPVRDDGSN